MELKKQKPSIVWGALTGALLTPLLIVLFFIGERFAGLPFLPLNFFDWIARSLPGGLITFGIDTMVDLLIGLGLGADLDTAAKTAEQFMGIGLFFGLGVVTTTLFYAILNRIDYRELSYLPGISYGVAWGLPMLVLAIPLAVSATAPPLMQYLWSALLFIGFGTAVGWTYNSIAFAPISVQSKTGDVKVHQIDRREFMVRVGGASATLTVIGAGLGTLLGDGTTQVASGGDTNTSATTALDLPNADASVQPAPGTRPELTPVADHYRIDILSGGLPSIPQDYTLPITGLVDNSVDWTLDEIMAMPSQSEFITMSCISNRIAGSLISTTKWTGVSFQEILERVQPTAEAGALRIVGYDDFDEYLEIDMIREDPRIMLAYHFNDEPLPLRNGYPLRIHIPDRYGMKQPKWIRSIEFISEWEPGYWVRRGWSEQAIVNQTSVIDTVASNDVFNDADGQLRVPIGGIAWAGDRPIAAVEVSVDSGPWEVVQLREPLSDRAWTLWRYDWAFAEGNHTFEVRSYEQASNAAGDPLLQPTRTRGTRPDGATGVHAVTATLTNSENVDDQAIES
ncbi:MAG: molybdopterin-dependent oxidoreductase [Anaerolineae bacterium]